MKKKNIVLSALLVAASAAMLVSCGKKKSNKTDGGADTTTSVETSTSSNGSTAQTTVMIPKGTTGNRSYTANWNIITYTITYNLNGGTLPSSVETTVTVDYDINDSYEYKVNSGRIK